MQGRLVTHIPVAIGGAQAFGKKIEDLRRDPPIVAGLDRLLFEQKAKQENGGGFWRFRVPTHFLIGSFSGGSCRSAFPLTWDKRNQPLAAFSRNPDHRGGAVAPLGRGR